MLTNLILVTTCNIYMYQIITFYTLNLYNIICRLYLNRARRNPPKISAQGNIPFMGGFKGLLTESCSLFLEIMMGKSFFFPH